MAHCRRWTTDANLEVPNVCQDHRAAVGVGQQSDAAVGWLAVAVIDHVGRASLRER